MFIIGCENKELLPYIKIIIIHLLLIKLLLKMYVLM